MSKKPAQKEDFGQSKDGCKSHLCIQTGVLTNRRSFTFAPMVGSMDFRAGPYIPSFVGLTHRVKGRQYIYATMPRSTQAPSVGRDAATVGSAEKPKSSCAKEIPL
jgi:hypothetical protein